MPKQLVRSAYFLMNVNIVLANWFGLMKCLRVGREAGDRGIWQFLKFLPVYVLFITCMIVTAHPLLL